jgi:hypothetical protein
MTMTMLASLRFPFIFLLIAVVAGLVYAAVVTRDA